MELRQLEYFVAVAEEANFTRAAERVHVAQPAVSAQIRHLERELGHELFDRSRRAVRLTAAGAAVLPHARAALAAVTAARTAVDELGALVRGSVVVGTVTAHDFDMPDLLAQFHAAHPLVDITLTTDESDALLDGLRSGRLDVAIVSVGAELPAGLAAEVVTDQRIVAAVADDHPWGRRHRVALRDLVDHPIIALPSGAGIRHQFDQACRASGVAVRVAFEASTPNALAELAERGLGVAVLPESVAITRPALHPLPITPELRGRLVFAWRVQGPMSPAAKVLIEMARRRLRVGGPA
ncbi:LysR family transcriptional regulator [Mycolicibacterium boenickei]|uniref:Probable hydrogen peroxide-inducible genes activator n=1 Tax=Mycolicibacterium boenickei TaxID=146017 RepID=A0AAX3A3V0_9MYCO|nr:LysR family transcriptional regulator [Mycolicibacterium boenickei]PEG61530.1 LysR family transcriptional regulator [Mycolicibacterium boenickei]UNC02255.1 LysR family transcriptional regulator [Mycolicibacterium boenickei]BBX92227.1 LysR family transcriptional regulator [Mycolicibacterium boenickei]